MSCDLPGFDPQQQMDRSAACKVKEILQDNDTLCVYGAGKDTIMWGEMARNVSGHLHVFEHSLEWADAARESTADLPVTVHSVNYTSSADDWGSQLVKLDPFLTGEKCDVSVIDSPVGAIHGRGQSAQQALDLTKNGGSIFLDDSTRYLETRIIDEILSSNCSKVTHHDIRDGFFECHLAH